MKKEVYKLESVCFSAQRRPVNLPPVLRCCGLACLGPGDCIFTAALTAVAFHSGDRWRAFSPNDTEGLQSSALTDLRL